MNVRAIASVSSILAGAVRARPPTATRMPVHEHALFSVRIEGIPRGAAPARRAGKAGAGLWKHEPEAPDELQIDGPTVL